jgi:hypothetical protein
MASKVDEEEGEPACLIEVSSSELQHRSADRVKHVTKTLTAIRMDIPGSDNGYELDTTNAIDSLLEKDLAHYRITNARQWKFPFLAGIQSFSELSQ